MKRLLLTLASLLTPAFAQISQLATNPDGSVLLFESRFRLQSEPDLLYQSKIYRWQNGSIERLAVERQLCCQGHPYVHRPFVAGDGSIYGWLRFPESSFMPVVPVLSVAQPQGFALPGDFVSDYFRISPNGRFAVGSSWNVLIDRAERYDIATGERTQIPARPPFLEVANDGTVAYILGSSLTIQPPGGQPRVFPVAAAIAGLSLSADAQWLALESREPAQPRRLKVISASTGESFHLANDPGPWSFAANRAIYSDSNRLIAWDTDARVAYTLTTAPEPFAEVLLAANGTVAWAATVANRLWRIDVASGQHQEILPPLGHSSSNGIRGTLVPGSAVLVPGVFTQDQQVFAAGEAWPTSEVDEDGLWFQVPWEAAGAFPPDAQLVVRTPGNPFETWLRNLPEAPLPSLSPYFPQLRLPGYDPAAVAAHQDFHGLVTPDDPARPGETVHIYVTGLGPLDKPVATGEPGPSDHAHPKQAIVCVGRLGESDWLGLNLPFVAYAAGAIGFYQIDLTIPPTVPDGRWVIRCGDWDRLAGGSLYTKP